MRPARQLAVLIGHILCLGLQQAVQEINATWEARVDQMTKTGRAANPPIWALEASSKANAGNVPIGVTRVGEGTSCH